MALTRVVVGRLGRPHGIRGDVTVEIRTDEPELRFAPGSSLLVQGDSRKPLVIESGRVHSGVLQLKFKGVEDRTAAEALRGIIVEAEVDEDELPEDEDEFYDRQLLGLVVFDAEDTRIGVIADVLHLPAQDVFVIKADADDRELLIPFTFEFVPEIDVVAKRVVVTPPPGLFDENFEVAGDTDED